MSSSPTGPTSTTGSSTSSPSYRASRAVEVIACGALAAHIREISARRGWPLVVRPLPARLHNRPEQITEYSERARSSAPTVMAYADCGTYGKLDEFCTANDIPRLPGLHCYDVYAGQEVIAKLFDEEPGTYLLTDYLVRTFDRTVLASLGLDKHPDLWPDYFAHYTRVVWLAQAPTPHLEAEAQRIANLFALPLTTIPTGLGGLESALASLLEGFGGVAHTANRSAPVAHTANPGPRLAVAHLEEVMKEIPARASAVVIGAGIVGNSLVHHLALLGWRDVVLVDKGPMPNPGGSTGHASNFIFPIEYSKMMFDLTRDSTEQYKALGVFTESGGIEVARTPERMIELRRRTTQAKSWGIPAEILTPEGVRKLVPYLDESVILGGGYFPTVGVVDSLRAGTLMRDAARASGALTVLSGTEVLDVKVSGDRVRGVVTTAGEIEAGNVVICCGVWSPRIARMAGARLALTPIVHQMISVGPIALFAGTTGEISYPIVRDVDTGMYERQHGGDMEVGSYMHRPIIVDPDTIPSNEEAALSPTELPFTADDFDPQLAQALELMPELLGDEKAGIRYAINGLISMTPDGHPLLGETPEVKGLWSAAASWIKEGPGCGRAVAELMSGKVPTIDVHEADVARLYPSSRATGFVRARAAESFNKMYGIVHPAEQFESARPLRTGPLYERTRELGAVCYETARWERPHWYASNEPLLETYAGRLMERPAEWESRWWSPIINAEHLAMRDACGLVDLSAFTVLDVTGPGALAGLQALAVAQLDVPVGRVVYTSLLNDEGGFVADLTIMRLGAASFRVVTGASTGGSDAKWIADHLPDDAQLADVSSGWATLGLWGPRAWDVLTSVQRDGDQSPPRTFGISEFTEIGGAVVLASRISYVGEFGWELHVPAEQAGQLWDLLRAAGRPHGLVPVGIGVYATTARLEKGYRAYGAELTPEYNLVEAGMTRPRVKPQSFIGKDAYLGQREVAPDAVLCTLTVDSVVSADGTPRYALGGEPILALDGSRLVDALGRPSYVTSAGSGPSVGKHLLMAYLPPAAAATGTSLLVEYMGEPYPVTVAGSGAVFDPSGSRMR